MEFNKDIFRWKNSNEAKKMILRYYLLSSIKNRRPEINRKKIYRVFLERWAGMTYAQIGKKVGLSGSRVMKIINTNTDNISVFLSQRTGGFK